MLKIFQSLFESLQMNDVQFCNWKGHHAVESHLYGDGDLDLFIPLDYKNQFRKISKRIGFKRVISYQADHKFIEHYYGFDVDSSKFVHIHVYFKIVTGEHISKNYILPLDKYLIDNKDTTQILPILNDRAKRSIFLIRYFLKIGSVYGIAQYLREKNKYSLEWKSFKKIGHYEDILELNLSSKDLNYFDKVFESSNPLKSILLSIKMKKKLKKFRRRKFSELLIFNFKNFVRRLTNKYFIKKKKLFNPGFVIAICGLDGSGKSSVVKALKQNFSEHFSVKIFHLGRPSSNLLTLSFKPFILIFSFIKRLIKKNKKKTSENRNISIIYAIRYVLLAYDRKVESERAHKFSNEGYLVICDRYPGLTNGKMDSPRIPENQERGALYKFCHRLEKNIYISIKPADSIFHLSVPLKEAIRRNNKRIKFGKESDDEIHERYKVNTGVRFLSNNYNNIDATFSFEKVLSLITNLVWNLNLK